MTSLTDLRNGLATRLATITRGPHLDVPDPRRDVVTSLPERLSTLRIDLVDP